MNGKVIAAIFNEQVMHKHKLQWLQKKGRGMGFKRQTARSVMVLGLLLPCFHAVAESVTVKPTGIYATIDTRQVIETMRSLMAGSSEQKHDAAEAVMANPENYAPPVFYALSHELFEDGRKDEAMFWFYAGQLRARFDANRCADVSARSAVGVLNSQYGPSINQYAFQDLPKLEALIPKVIDWDRKTPYHYDHRWINLHGMNAVMSGLSGRGDSSMSSALSLPEDQWSAIAEKTRRDYWEGFQKAMLSAKSHQ